MFLRKGKYDKGYVGWRSTRKCNDEITRKIYVFISPVNRPPFFNVLSPIPQVSRSIERIYTGRVLVEVCKA